MRVQKVIESFIKRTAFHLNNNIFFETKSHYGGPELVYVVSEHREPLHTLTGSKTLTPRHVEALKRLGFNFIRKEISRSTGL